MNIGEVWAIYPKLCVLAGLAMRGVRNDAEARLLLGIAQLAAAAASSAALLVRTNLVISDDDWRLSETNTCAAEAARAAQRAGLAPR